MKKIEIIINGKAHPCRPTMGAMLRFKQETGKEVTQIDPESFTDLCTYLWCCLVSACKKDGVDFNLSLMDFADCIGPEDMQQWAEAMQAAGAAEDTSSEEKKSL